MILLPSRPDIATCALSETSISIKTTGGQGEETPDSTQEKDMGSRLGERNQRPWAKTTCPKIVGKVVCFRYRIPIAIWSSGPTETAERVNYLGSSQLLPCPTWENEKKAGPPGQREPTLERQRLLHFFYSLVCNYNRFQRGTRTPGVASPVVHKKQLELLHVVDEELVEAVGQQVAGALDHEPWFGDARDRHMLTSPRWILQGHISHIYVATRARYRQPRDFGRPLCAAAVKGPRVWHK